ncbi:hypothetical protein B0H19DRAFT_1042600 [Mycena capillaripes]|nr:hypothetical protein B0H19DRAFT_1042600 [Mycena capillaripes]
MSRRSARLGHKIGANRDSPTVPSTENSVPRKRTKKAVEPELDGTRESKPQKSRGKLRFITEMPLDILFEIFGQLLPADILHLSMSSKALRDILLRKSAAFIWKQAFLNIRTSAPPRCPDDLNEPQYANLLWGKHCFFCGNSPTIAFWECRVRTCKPCVLTKNFTSVGRASSSASNTFETAKNLCSKSWYSPRSREAAMYVCVTSDIHIIQKRLVDLAETKSDYQDFVNECRAIDRKKIQHATLCQNWAYMQKHNRRRQLKDAGKSRQDAILAKLNTLGWSTELSDWKTKHSFLALPVVRQNKELTERIWAKIEPELVAYLTEVKRLRLERYRIDVLRTRIYTLASNVIKDLNALPISEVRLSIPDICVMPEYRAILERPSDTEITKDDFADLLPLLPEQAEQWRQSNIKLLLPLLPSASKRHGNKTLDTRPLDLCTTFFRCHSCREPISYPRILSHACLNKLGSQANTDNNEDDVLLQAFRSAPWIHGQKGIVFDTEASNITTMLIKMCGQDPKTLTSAAMDELDSRFECVRCVHPSQGRLVMKWRIALLHELEDHYGETLKATSWKLLDPAEVITAKEREAKGKKRAPPSLLCPKCNTYTTFTPLQMRDHMISTHAKKSFDPVPHPDITIRMPPWP